MSEADGVWKTIRGRRIFIKSGQSLTEAMKESGKFDKKQMNTAKKIDELFEKKRKLEQKRAEAEIKEDLAKPIEKSEAIEEKTEFNSSDYNQIDNDSFNELSAKQKITKEQEVRLYDYNHGYVATDFAMGINNCLREPNLEMNFEQRKTMEMLQNVISKNKLEYNVKASRYVGEDYLKQEFNIEISHDRLEKEFEIAAKNINENAGKVITNKGFMSVSLTDNSIFKDNVVKLNTYIKEGANCFVTKNIEESEAILNTNTKYKILKAYNVVDDYGYSQINIDVEVLK